MKFKERLKYNLYAAIVILAIAAVVKLISFIFSLIPQ